MGVDNEIKIPIIPILCLLMTILASIIVGYISYNVGYNKGYNNSKTNLISTSVNDSIKLQVKQLDSLKNEKVIEVKGLSNDSTLQLFKQLVNEE